MAQTRPQPHPWIQRIRPHMVGAAPSVAPRLRLDSNESAYGPSPRALAAAEDALARLHRYDEAPDLRLAPAIAARFGLDPERIVTGQGSDDLLARVARAFLGPGTELVRTANGYLKVPNYAHACGAEVVSVPDRAFIPDIDAMIAALTERTRIVYLANPENPAGTHLPAAEIQRLHAALPPHVLLVLDCAYEEYVDAPGHAPPHRMVEAAENVVMARSFSKIFGLAGARVGWLYGPPNLVDSLRRIGLTFPVSGPSLAAALAALQDTAHTDRVRAATAAERARMARALADLGLTPTPSQTNFLLVHFPDPDRSAEACAAALAAHGILVRRLASDAFQSHLRLTLGLPAENDEALAAIAAFLG